MAQYRVTLYCQSHQTHFIDANDEDEAHDKAVERLNDEGWSTDEIMDNIQDHDWLFDDVSLIEE